METDWLLWMRLDEFGNFVQTNRILPGMFLYTMGFTRNGMPLEEMRVGYQNGHVDIENSRVIRLEAGWSLGPHSPPKVNRFRFPQPMLGGQKNQTGKEQSMNP